MSSFTVFSTARNTAALLLAGSLQIALAADAPTAASSAVTPQSNPEQFDRDGKHICGYSVMTESERAGFRSILHTNKNLADRDLVRAENCKAMRKRAQDKGVPLDE